jgi:hypothetical protein
VWFIEYRHSRRSDVAGIKFVNGEAVAATESQHLAASGYIVTKVAPISKVHMGAFPAGTLAGAEQPLLRSVDRIPADNVRSSPGIAPQKSP